MEKILHGQIWSNVMSKVHQNLPKLKFEVPESKNLVCVKICKDSGLLSNNCANTSNEYYLSGTEPLDYCTKHTNSKVKPDIKTEKEQNTNITTENKEVEEVQENVVTPEKDIEQVQENKPEPEIKENVEEINNSVPENTEVEQENSSTENTENIEETDYEFEQ